MSSPLLWKIWQEAQLLPPAEMGCVCVCVERGCMLYVELTWDIALFNLPSDSKLGFLNVGLRPTSIIFLVHYKKIKNLRLLMLLQLLNFFQFMKQMKYWFLNVSLDCTSKFLLIHQRVGKLEFLNSAYVHIFSDCEDTLSSLVCKWKRGANL